ncbi:MAG: CapA family protein, partial [Patescibacteria group bacterium]|nr:CapA family protein [Patescibacteria group bacterium]
KEQILFTGSQNISEEQYKPAVLFSNGQKIAFFAITDLLNGYDRYADPYVVTSSDEDLENLIFHIKQNKKKMDWIIVSMHAGNEYQKKPSTRQKKLAHALIDSGADIIIGHHPHVPQGIERHNSGIIFYSLGNFAFWQPFEFWTQNSFVLEITLKPNHVFEYKIVPVEAGWQPKLVEDMDAQKKMIDYIAKLQI